MATSDSTPRPSRVKDLSGKRFGFQVVIDFAEMRGKTPYWNVLCDCGSVRSVSGHTLMAGRSTRCRNNCPASNPRTDETGNVYHRLTVVESAGSTSSGDSMWLCRCECGTMTTVARGELRKGSTKSCGCLRSSQGGDYKTTEYRSWKEMKRRCYNPRNSQYHLYGGRGIAICDRWRKSFVNFLADMGTKPFPEATIDRFPDMNGNYDPGNCRWATKREQSQNSRKARMLTYNGETLCLREWSRRIGITHSTLIARLERGWTLERALSTPRCETAVPSRYQRHIITPTS